MGSTVKQLAITAAAIYTGGWAASASGFGAKTLAFKGPTPLPPDVSFKIKSFKSCIKPVVVVSQNISKLDITGSVS